MSGYHITCDSSLRWAVDRWDNVDGPAVRIAASSNNLLHRRTSLGARRQQMSVRPCDDWDDDRAIACAKRRAEEYSLVAG